MNILGAGGDDCNVFLYDSRVRHRVDIIKAHSRPVCSLAFHPVERFLVATSSADHTIALWDQRNLQTPLHTMVGHRASVTSVAWSPFSTCILASGSEDCRVNIWDISKVGETVPEDMEEEGPAELVFVHGGHKAKVNDLSWNPNVGALGGCESRMRERSLRWRMTVHCIYGIWRILFFHRRVVILFVFV